MAFCLFLSSVCRIFASKRLYHIIYRAMYKDDFLQYLKAERNYSDYTVAGYEESLREFEDFQRESGRQMPLDWLAVQGGDIREWIVELMDKGRTATTTNTRLSALRSFYRYLLMRGQIEVNPVHGISGPKKQKPLPKFIRESEMDRLLDKVTFPETFEGQRDHLILLTFYSTGIRRAELVGLDEDSVDFGSRALKVLGKRNKERIIPFGEEMAAEMKSYLLKRRETFPGTTDNAFFLNAKGQRIKAAQVETLVKKYLSTVTSQRFRSPHVLRHSFATAMLNHGAGIETVKELLGHESVATTQIYTHTTFEELKSIYQKSHPRN